MAQVTVTIAGRPYRMACGEGEEAHLQDLGRVVDAKIDDLKRVFGEIGDQRLTIMAAVTIADELTEANRRIAELEGLVEELQATTSDKRSRQDAWTEGIAVSLVEAAERVERLAQVMNGAAREE